MSHEPDSNLGGFVKNIAKDVVSDLVSIPKEAARQAVGLPSDNLHHELGGRNEVANHDEIRIRDDQGVTLNEKSDNIQESRVNDNGNHQDKEVERTLIYQDVSGDEVAKEQKTQSASVAHPVGGSSDLMKEKIHVETPEIHMSAQKKETKVSDGEIAPNEDKDEVYELLYKAVWQGYGA